MPSKQSADPKAGAARRTSGTPFPYYNLAKSVEVAKAMYDRAGGTCDRAQLAAFLGYNGVSNGSFLTRVTSAKMFGLIAQPSDLLVITDLGRAIVAPVTESAADRARAEAFLKVELFKKVFDEYNGQTLPPEMGLRNLFLAKYQIVPDRVNQTVNVMLDSAETAGFFRTAGSRTKLVMPVFGASAPTPPTPPKDPAGDGVGGQRDSEKGNGGGTGNGAGNGQNGRGTSIELHPAIMGLLQNLPTSDTPLSDKRRAAIVAAFKATIDNIYGDFNDY